MNSIAYANTLKELKAQLAEITEKTGATLAVFTEDANDRETMGDMLQQLNLLAWEARWEFGNLEIDEKREAAKAGELAAAELAIAAEAAGAREASESAAVEAEAANG